MAKSADAFRTISEVADWLGIQAHVLRFWESKFTQVRPVKRAGGRRYYRPNDMLLLGGIKQLLHEDGLTIKGVQKILREEGMGHVAALSPPLDELTQSLLEETPPTPFIEAPEEPQEETGVVLNFDKTPAQPEKPQEAEATVAATPVETSAPEETPDVEAKPVTSEATPESIVETTPQTESEATAAPVVEEDTPDLTVNTVADAASEQSNDENQPEPADQLPEPQETAAPKPEPEDVIEPEAETIAEPEVNEHITIVEPDPIPRPEPSFDDVPLVAGEIAPKPEAPEADHKEAAQAASEPPQQPETPPTDDDASSEPVEQAASEAAALPAFLRRPTAEQPAAPDTPLVGTPENVEETADVTDVTQPPEPPTPPARKPRIIDTPAFTPEHEIAAAPAILTTAYRCGQLRRAQARKIAPLLDKLAILRDSMASPRTNPTQTAAPAPSND